MKNSHGFVPGRVVANGEIDFVRSVLGSVKKNTDFCAQFLGFLADGAPAWHFPQGQDVRGDRIEPLSTLVDAALCPDETTEGVQVPEGFIRDQNVKSHAFCEAS